MTTSFWENKARLQRLSGIRESDDRDDTHELNDESRRTTKVIELVKQVFNRLGLLLVEDNAIHYFEDNDFTVVVIIDIPMNEGVSVKRLAQLYTSGLSTEFTLDFAKGQGMQVQFVLSDEHRDPM